MNIYFSSRALSLAPLEDEVVKILEWNDISVGLIIDQIIHAAKNHRAVFLHLTIKPILSKPFPKRRPPPALVGREVTLLVCSMLDHKVKEIFVHDLDQSLPIKNVISWALQNDCALYAYATPKS